jgi:hypothetical protein
MCSWTIIGVDCSSMELLLFGLDENGIAHCTAYSYILFYTLHICCTEVQLVIKFNYLIPVGLKQHFRLSTLN